MAPRRSAAVACASAAVLGSGALCGSAFVPSSQGLSRPQPFAAQEGAELRSVEIGETTYFSASSMAGSAALASAAAVVAIAGKKVSTRTYKSLVALQFSGGDVAPAPKAFDPATELGVQDPVGFWDPLGFCEDKDEATFKRRRAVEIKHGRISMYATIGYIVPEYFKFPGYLSPSLGIKFSDVPNGLAALSKIPVLGGAQIIAFAGLIETTGFFSGSTTDGRGARGLGQMKDSTESGEPGNYGVGFPNFLGTVSDPEERKTKLAAELANGRLAMMAIIGMFFQDGLTGSAWGDWALYTASPLRAAEEDAATPPSPPPFDPAQQIGAMAPLGYFDPAGFSKVGDEPGFRNLRSAELKHGRVAMMAALGGVAQHYVKFPGFDSVPAGMGAVTTAPGTYGFAALFAIAGALELAVWTQDPNKEVGDFGDPLGLGMYDEDMRNKELNNGRFAMFAALGIVAADLATGKDAIQQFGL